MRGTGPIGAGQRSDTASDIVAATRAYERWMATLTPVVRADLTLKHQRMDSDPHSFLRCTFYRWAGVWPHACADLAGAPQVLAVGDTHIENFGTWRDAEGRLVWGINDFDEAHTMPYTVDLTRLATSALLAIRGDSLGLKPRVACDVILSGYSEGLLAGGRPFVLAERDRWLQKLALAALGDPIRFWKRLDDLPTLRGKAPESARQAIQTSLVQPLPYRLARRQAGRGSLGRQRLVAAGDWRGGRVAREVKALLPSAWGWANPRRGDGRDDYMRIVNAAVRCPDPYLGVANGWIVRRLAPDSARIELGMLPGNRDEDRLLHAMGWETANIHLGSLMDGSTIAADMQVRPADWLRNAARRMQQVVERDWKRWLSSRAHAPRSAS